MCDIFVLQIFAPALKWVKNAFFEKHFFQSGIIWPGGCSCCFGMQVFFTPSYYSNMREAPTVEKCLLKC